MAITIDGVIYRNLQEQVGKNAEDIASLQDTQKKIISGDQQLTKTTVAGALDVEGKFTAGGDAEVDGKLSLNSIDNLILKTGSLKRYVHEIIASYRGPAAFPCVLTLSYKMYSDDPTAFTEYSAKMLPDSDSPTSANGYYYWGRSYGLYGFSYDSVNNSLLLYVYCIADNTVGTVEVTSGGTWTISDTVIDLCS